MTMDLKKKVGPFPLYVYLGAGTVAILALYMRMRANSNAATTDTLPTQQQSPTLDPTTGLPYAGGGLSSGGSGVTAPDTSGAYAPPSIAQEVSDVTGLIGALQSSGLMNQPSQDGLSDSDKAFFTGLFNQNNAQKTPDHSKPTPIKDRKIITKASPAHGGKLYDYVKSSSGKTLIPVKPHVTPKPKAAKPKAPAKPKATPKAEKHAAPKATAKPKAKPKPKAAHR